MTGTLSHLWIDLRSKEINPILSQPAQQKVFADSFSGCCTDLATQRRKLQELNDPLGRLLHCINQKTVLSVADLAPDAGDVSANHSGSLPHRFSDSKAEAFSDGLLQHDGGFSLQRVDKKWILDRNHDHSLVCGIMDRFENYLSLWIVDCGVTQQDKRAIDLLACEVNGLDYTAGVLPSIEPDFLPMVKGKLGGAVTSPAYRFD